MKLYSARYAPNPRRVTMFLAEKGVVDLPIVNLDLAKGEHRDAAFLRIAPLGRVPVLELDDGRALSESRAICSYLESIFPTPNLMGEGAVERAEIEMWDRRAEMLFTLPMMHWVRHASPILAAVEQNQNAEFARYNEQAAMAGARMLDERFRDHAFVLGERFSIADITIAAGLDFAKLLKWRPGEDFPNLARWRSDLANRPSGKTEP